MTDGFSCNATAAEFALRSLAIEALGICQDADLKCATISVIPADDGDSDDFDWWKVSFEESDGKCTQVSTSYGCDDA